MKTSGLSSINVEKALETIGDEALTPGASTDLVQAYWVVKEFIDVVKSEVIKDRIPVLLKRKRS